MASVTIRAQNLTPDISHSRKEKSSTWLYTLNPFSTISTGMSHSTVLDKN